MPRSAIRRITPSSHPFRRLFRYARDTSAQLCQLSPGIRSNTLALSWRSPGFLPLTARTHQNTRLLRMIKSGSLTMLQFTPEGLMIRLKTSSPQQTPRFSQERITGPRLPFSGVPLIPPFYPRGMIVSHPSPLSPQSPSRISKPRPAPPGAPSLVKALAKVTLRAFSMSPCSLIPSSVLWTPPVRASTSLLQIPTLPFHYRTRIWPYHLPLTTLVSPPLSTYLFL